MVSGRLAVLASTSAMLFGSHVAYGQTAPAATAAVDPTADSAGGDIIVTAQRRDQRLADVPISITAIGAQTLTASGVTSTIGLTRLTPGLLAVDQGFNFVAAIRGISSSGNVAGDESNVALYVDGVYVATPTAGLFSLNNIDRIEVLKGPQGTLFGRNATGGAIRVITRQPTQQTTFDASAEYSPSYNGKRLQAYVSGGLTSTIAADLALYYYSDTGFIDNVNPTTTTGELGRTYSLSLRSKVVWSPTDTLDFTLSGNHSFSRNSVNLSSRSEYLAVAPLVGFNELGAYQTSRSFAPNSASTISGVSLTAAWKVAPSLHLNSITAYNSVVTNSILDGDDSYLNILKISAIYPTKTFTQETTLTSSYGGIVDFAVGAFYYNSKACGCDISVYLSPYANPVSNTEQHVDTESIAGFGELTVTPVRNLEFIGGLRFTHETKRSFGFATAPVPFTASDSDTANNTSVRATARYTLNDDDANVYATYSTGFKSSAYGSIAPVAQKARPEKIEAFEVGFKAPLFSRRLLFTAAAFHYNYTDIQLSTLDLQTGSVALQNAGRAKVDGGELALSGRVDSHLKLNTGLSWLPTAKYTSFPGHRLRFPIRTGRA